MDVAERSFFFGSKNICVYVTFTAYDANVRTSLMFMSYMLCIDISFPFCPILHRFCIFFLRRTTLATMADQGCIVVWGSSDYRTFPRMNSHYHRAPLTPGERTVRILTCSSPSKITGLTTVILCWA